jgi:hypothetical protein
MRNRNKLIYKFKGQDTPASVGPGAYTPQYDCIFKRIQNPGASHHSKKERFKENTEHRRIMTGIPHTYNEFFDKAKIRR